MGLKCGYCGKDLIYSGRGRPPDRFCSREHKDLAANAASRAETQRKRAEQRCRQCGGPVPLDAGNRVRTCSRKCGNDWQNQQRQAAKRADWMASDPVCQRPQCGKPIPESRARGAKYCSPGCKKKEAAKRWRAASPYYNRGNLYGITMERWDEMFADQGGVCAICGTAEWGGRHDRPHTDHDHATGIFRGILCDFCNRGLGMFRDDPARLRAAAAYLEKAIAA